MGDSFEALEAKKARRSLDRMHGTKDIGQQGSVSGPLFQLGQTAFHAVQTLLTLNQEFSRQFIHCIPVSAFRCKNRVRKLHWLYRREGGELERTPTSAPGEAWV